MSLAVLDINGTQYQLNEDGRLHNIDDWTKEIAIAIAQNENITLTDDHWAIINLLQDFYGEFNHSPIMKLFLKEVSNKLGTEFTSKDYLSQLFPGDTLKQSTKIAGLPCPHAASFLTKQKATLVEKKETSVPNEQKSFEFEDKTYHLTQEGNLVERYAWSENMASFLAENEALKLTDDHWLVINFMRNFYEEYLVSPMVKLLIKHMKQSLSEEKCNKKYLYELFPDGPSKQGSRIAGLPHPAGCID